MSLTIFAKATGSAKVATCFCKFTVAQPWPGSLRRTEQLKGYKDELAAKAKEHTELAIAFKEVTEERKELEERLEVCQTKLSESQSDHATESRSLQSHLSKLELAKKEAEERAEKAERQLMSTSQELVFNDEVKSKIHEDLKKSNEELLRQRVWFRVQGNADTDCESCRERQMTCTSVFGRWLRSGTKHCQTSRC